jgi:hypothetical protein
MLRMTVISFLDPIEYEDASRIRNRHETLAENTINFALAAAR